MDLSPEEHVVMQGALQRWIDSALSKTCNAPNNYTIENVQDLYELMYKLGCKGGTIYRDGSRDEQVLMLKAEPAAAEPAPALDIDAEARKLGYIKPEDVLGDANLIAKVLATAGVQVQPEPVSRRRKDKVMQSINCKQQTHLGSCYTDVTYDRNNDPLEIFVRSGKAGSDVASLAEGLGRLASTLLTIPSPVPPMERLRDIAGHLEGIGGSDSVGFGRAQIKSMPDAVGKSLAIIADELDARKGKVPAADPEEKVIDEPKPARKGKKASADICPSCGGATYIREEGCRHCTSCGHSACG
jgi:ribonucleoside-diphosphate reductase alpha chain